MRRYLWVAPIAALLYAANTTVALAVPNPGGPQAPPGSGKFLKVMSWGEWVGFAVCVGGLIVAGALLAIENRNGGGGGVGGRVINVLLGVILIGGAVGIVGALA